MYDTFVSTLTHEIKDALNDLLSNVTQDCGTQEQFLKTSPIFQQHTGGIPRVFEESDGWRSWPNCQILELVCPYGKQIAQGPDANSTYQLCQWLHPTIASIPGCWFKGISSSS